MRPGSWPSLCDRLPLGVSSSRSAVRLYDAGLHNRSRNRARNWVHSRIWRSRDYFLSTPPTRKAAIVPFLRLSLSDATSYLPYARVVVKETVDMVAPQLALKLGQAPEHSQ